MSKVNNLKDQEENKKQLFVRNLSFEATKEKIEELFQEYGPLKNVSLAVDNQGKPKGFGFIKFAIEEDAKSALEALNGKNFLGRSIIIEHGIKKERPDKESRKQNLSEIIAQAQEQVKKSQEEREQEEEEKNLKRKQKSDRNDKKKLQKKEDVLEGEEAEDKEDDKEGHIKRSRQILIFGIPIDVNKKHFKYVLNKISRKSTVELIKQDHPLSSNLMIVSPLGKIMLITCPSRKETEKVLKALNFGTINSLGFAKYVAKAGEEDEEDKSSGHEQDPAMAPLLLKNNMKSHLTCRLLSEMTDSSLRKRKCRVIIRNLSFQASVQNVVDKMLKFGPLVELDIPSESTEKVVKNFRKNKPELLKGSIQVKEVLKGYCFVTFLCEGDAKKAIEASSKGFKVCNRDVAIDYCMSKNTYEKYGKEEEKEEEEQKEDEQKENEEEKEEDEEKMDVEDDNEEKDDEDEEGEEQDDGDEEEDEDDNEDVEDEDEEDEDEEEEEEEDEEEKNEEEKPKTKIFDGDVHNGCTIFVRGLSSDTTTYELKGYFKTYGRIAMCLLVTDKKTNISKGSAFIKFHEKESAEKCLKALDDSPHGPGNVMIKERLCKVALAVDKESAEKLRGDLTISKDKRNLYLANEGLVNEGEEKKDGDKKKEDALTEFDREKRKRAQNDKKKKLSNPLFFVSNVRVSIRNLSKNVTEEELKNLVYDSVKKGLTKKLVTEKDMRSMFYAQGIQGVYEGMSDYYLKPLLKKGEKNINYKQIQPNFSVPTYKGSACVKQCKIMLDNERMKNGVAQSKGFAFVEFRHHAFALACLRELNNNPAYTKYASTTAGAGGSRLMLEFTIENIRKVKILNERKQKLAEKQSE